MIIGTGVDIIKIERFVDKADKPRFMLRIFTTNEQNYLKNRGTQSMAGLFAAKEAVVKALGIGFRGFWPCDVEIAHDEFGKPHVILHGAANDAVGVHLKLPRRNKKATRHKRQGCFNIPQISINISISHNETDALAFAVISLH